MISTGIVRRIDDLNRIVIPADLCRQYNITVGDAFEIFADDDMIGFKKYNPFNFHVDKVKCVQYDMLDILNNENLTEEEDKIVRETLDLLQQVYFNLKDLGGK